MTETVVFAMSHFITSYSDSNTQLLSLRHGIVATAEKDELTKDTHINTK